MNVKLDDRLAAVARQIRSTTHIDIGSDHGGLLVTLLNQGHIKYGIAVEDKQTPYDNSVRALAGLPAEVRFGDGLEPIEVGEACSLSICGMGAEHMQDILVAHPDRIPPRVILQVFHKSEILRKWALENCFHLVDDHRTAGKRSFTIMSFVKSKDTNDPAYVNLNREAALLFGPFALNRQDEQFDDRLRREEAWWRRLDRLTPSSAKRLQLIRSVMDDRQLKPLPQWKLS